VLLHALASVRGDGLVARKASIRSWARALRKGLGGAYPIGRDRIGVAMAGHAGFKRVRDPRRVVVVWEPGSYRLRDVCLEIERMPAHPDEMRPSAPSAHEAWVPASALVWPLSLTMSSGSASAASDVGGPMATAPRHEVDIDLDTGRALHGAIVVDGSGRQLLPRPSGAGTRDVSTSERATASPWIVLRLHRANDGDVVAEPQATLPWDD
jgi:hypothetical protein